MSNDITTAFKAMQTDIQISMDDVVSAFVSQYENNLYARKKDLTAQIKAIEAKHEKLTKEVKESANGKALLKEKLPFGLILTLNETAIRWESREVHFTLEIKNPKKSGYYHNSLSVTKSTLITAAKVKEHDKMQEELTELRSILAETLVSLKSVARKEREVRGRIAIRKLEDSGYADLMQDGELAQLVQLDQLD
jgi:hypothetical protein